MARAIETHFYVGLRGGYVPSRVEHYNTRGEAIEALREHAADLVDWHYMMNPEDRDAYPYRGSVRGGYIYYREGKMYPREYHDHAYVEPCPDPDACKRERDEYGDEWGMP